MQSGKSWATACTENTPESATYKQEDIDFFSMSWVTKIGVQESKCMSQLRNASEKTRHALIYMHT